MPRLREELRVAGSESEKAHQQQKGPEHDDGAPMTANARNIKSSCRGGHGSSLSSSLPQFQLESIDCLEGNQAMQSLRHRLRRGTGHFAVARLQGQVGIPVVDEEREA
jgi:hypothetical protein